jgi:hypothetical protein
MHKSVGYFQFIVFYPICSQQSSAAGAIGSASAYGVGGSRFEPWVVQFFFLFSVLANIQSI